MKLLKKLSTILLIVVFFSACEKGIEKNKCLLLKVTVNSTTPSSTEYTYDSEDRVKSKQINIDGNQNIREEYTYDDEGRIATINAYGSDITIHYSYQEFDYVSDEKIIFYVYSPQDSTLTGTGEFIYNGSECGYVEYKYNTTPQTGNFDFTIDANYTGSNCDVEYITSDANGFVQKTTIINDDKNGSVYWAALPHLRANAIHNQIESTYQVGQNVDSIYSYRAEYEYNLNDYPTKATFTHLDGNVVEHTYEYDCI